MSQQKTVVVDFDGTLVDHEYPDVGKVKEGAAQAMKIFKQLGWRIIISSCRTCKYLPELFAPKLEDGSIDWDWVNNPMERQTTKDMVRILQEAGIPYDEIDDGSKGKAFGDLYIDDKGFRFQNNWREIAGWAIACEAAGGE